MENALLFGNGLNQLSAKSISWDRLLDDIKGKHLFDNGELPNTMIYERTLLEKPKTTKDFIYVEYDIKKEIASRMQSIPTNNFYQEIFDLKFKNYITTNYDYAFKNKILEQPNTKAVNNSTEDVYSIRRNTSIKEGGEKEICKIWNIHGEIDTPVSIMLGLDHYCGSIGKLDAYIKGTYDLQENNKKVKIDTIVSKLQTGKFDNRSWVELFFHSNIHILGLAFDYSETDLWWILNKRARIRTDTKTSGSVKNKVYFYVRELEPEREGLLKSFDVEVVKPDTLLNYPDFYEFAITAINRRKR
jgi:hypothetical protein